MDSWTSTCAQGLFESIQHCYPTICLVILLKDSSHGLSRLNSAFRCGGVEEVRWLWHLAVLHQHTVQLGQIMDSWTSTCAQGLLNCLLNICCTCAIVTSHLLLLYMPYPWRLGYEL